MHVFVCLKQVPDTQKVRVNPETGVLIRSGVESKMNPYDLYAIETALKIKEKTGCRITAVSMGPNSAMDVLKEAMAMGVDDGYLLSDRKFGGADVLATSYTIAQGIMAIDPGFDLIICGRQTTDGDTAQVGPSVSENLGIPHISWCTELLGVSEKGLRVKQNLSHSILTAEMDYPCLITVEKGIFQPRLPSYKLQQKSKDKEIKMITFSDMPDQDETHYGLNGSATKVERIYEPEHHVESEKIVFDDKTNALKLFEKLKEMKYLEER